MNWLKQIPKFSLLGCFLLKLAACGVKGDPMPPEKPPELGRGRPTYKRATEGLRVEPKSPKKDEDERE